MRNYHITLATGEERNLRAKSLEIRDGVLTLLTGSEVVVAYAPGVWTMVEVERVDDKTAEKG